MKDYNLLAYLYVICIVVFGLSQCVDANQEEKAQADVSESEYLDTKKIIDHIVEQWKPLAEQAVQEGRIPRTLNESKDNIHWANPAFDWTEGFFPGISWYLYDFTQDAEWKNIADTIQAQFEEHKYKTDNHDLGFIFNTSYGNGFRLTQNKAYKEVMLTAGKSLIQRFDPDVGCIQSWDVDAGWQAERGWKFPVIIDNMMNLELLFELSKLTGDSTYREIAIQHANTTIQHHFRENNSSWHVVDYNPETGEVRGKHTAQGYSDESAWARGQAWGLYGFTVAYRYTKNPAYLKQAQKIADFIIADPRVPDDGVPYWDYDAPKIPNEPRDASAAAIAASALLELSDYAGKKYADHAELILTTLSTDPYLAQKGANHHFILKHSVGSIPHGAEIDVPLNYADYYFVEALIRYERK